jgi:Txe/YoeB family toxin of toxin-antitoxin system
MGYRLEYSKQAKKDSLLLEQAGLDTKAKKLLSVIKRDPYEPPFEKLTSDLTGCYSRRINKQHRIVYEILPNTENLKDKNGVPHKGIAHIIRMWTHYE